MTRVVRDNGRMTAPLSTLAAPPAAPLAIGPHTVQPPVVLAPMAGITNAPFRTLCREFAEGVRGFGGAPRWTLPGGARGCSSAR